MKTIFITVLFTFLASMIFCQTSINIGESYVFKVTTEMRQCDLNGSVKTYSNISEVISPVGGRFTVVNETDSFFVIQFVKWNLSGIYKRKSSSIFHFKNQVNKANRFNFIKPVNAIETDSKTGLITLKSATNTTTLNFTDLPTSFLFWRKARLDAQISDSDNLKFFRVRKINFDKKIISYEEYSNWTGVSGTLFFPFKLRSQTGDFTNDITINGVVGFGRKFGRNKTLNYVIGVGIAAIKLDSANTKGKISQTSDRAAISISNGLIFQYKQIQIGYIVGWDFLNQNSVDNWIYNKKVWMSLGVGVNVFKAEDSKEKPKVQN